MMLADQTMYLPDDLLAKVDRASMAVSLEVRAPLLDHRVVEFSWRLPRVAEAARPRSASGSCGRCSTAACRKHIVERPKMGFSVPIDQWLRGPLRGVGRRACCRRRHSAGSGLLDAGGRSSAPGRICRRPAAGRRGALGGRHVPGLEDAVGDLNAAAASAVPVPDAAVSAGRRRLDSDVPRPAPSGPRVRHHRALLRACGERRRAARTGEQRGGSRRRWVGSRTSRCSRFRSGTAGSDTSGITPAASASGRVYTSVPVRLARLSPAARASCCDRARSISSTSTVSIWPSYLPACRTLPVVCVHHDVESALLRRRGRRRTPTLAPARISGIRPRLMDERGAPLVRARRLERRRAPSRIARLLKRIAPGARVAVVPNGVDIGGVPARRHGPADGVAYVGGTTPFPNLDALDFFCEQILPHLRRRQPMCACAVDRPGVDGSSSDTTANGWRRADRLRRRREAVHARRGVPHRAARVGGGTRLKILNSWAMGKAVVSTSIGCEGLAAVDGENILIRDDPTILCRRGRWPCSATTRCAGAWANAAGPRRSGSTAGTSSAGTWSTPI